MGSSAKKVALLYLVLVILAPDIAHAWGPVVHLDGANQIITGAVAVAPALLAVIRRHAFDFLYGAIAADFVVGKQHAKAHEHCHNWEVARELLRHARLHGTHREVFVLGYINHLGADTVAHNHTVPEMMVVHYRAKRAGHLYWEARADHRVLMWNPHLRDVWQELAGRKFPGHDRFLRNHVVPAIMSHRLSHGLYRSNLTLQRHRLWQKTLGRIDEKSKLIFDPKELTLWCRLAAQAGARAVDNPWSKRLDHLDPVGREALKWAKTSRKQLRRELRRGGETPKLNAMFERAFEKSKTVDLRHFEED